MSGAQRLSIVGIEIAEPQKLRPNWLQIAIGASIATLAHVAVFFFFAALQEYEPRPINHQIITWPTSTDEMSWVIHRPVLTTPPGLHSAIPVVIEKSPSLPAAASLASLKLTDPDYEEEKLDLMIWFGPSMEF